MKVKRILSVLLILCLLASFLPGVEMTARAEGEAMPGTAAPEEDGAAELFGSAAPEDGAAELMGSVEYIPYYAPEVAILNLKNGNNSDFYESVFRDGRYNAVQAGQFKDNGGTGTALTYDVSEGKSKEYTWKNFADTNLALLSDQLGHLKVNYSTTLKNNFHDHSWKTGWFSSTTQECIGRMYAGLYFPGQARRGENGPYYAGQHCDISKQETVRMGNMEFVDMPLVFNGTRTFYQTVNGESTYDWRRSDLNLLFSNQVYHYDGGNKDCTCGGWASGNFVGFYDGEAPYVTRVETRKNGVVSTDFSAGDTIEVILHMSEPVRFASNDASGMQNVGISLTVDGSSTKMFARLTKVVNSGISGYNPNTHTYNYAAWELHFEYKVPTTITNMYRINAIDFIHVPQTDDLNTMTGSETGLIHEQADITLKQIIKNGSGTSTFDIKKPKAKNGDMDEGFNAARSYITDLAGNSMLTYCPSIRLRVDSAAPYVEKVVVNAKTNNKWLKDRLGKQATDANYIDNSDTYLGDGDYFSLTMYMNEEVFFNGFSENDEFGLLPDVAYVTTNLMFKDRDNVIRPLKLSMYLAGSTTNANGDRVSILQSDGCNVQGEYNYQQFYAFIDKYRNMYLEEGWDDQITVTGIEWITKTGDAPASGMKLHDSSGNQVQNVTMTASEYQTLKAQAKPVDPQHKLNMVPNMAYHLDTAGPTVEVQPGVQNAPNQPFYVPFSVSDSASGGSGVDGMAGSIKLTTPNGRGTSFWYSVGVSATTDSQTVWHKGNFGEAFDFTEVDGSSGQMMYLHVKPDEEQSSEEQSTEKKQVYDFSSLAAEFILSDYAGNVNKQNKTLTNVSFDNVPPTLSCGNATRRYTDQGYLTVPVTARDTCGLKTLFYLWSTDPDAEYTADSDGWLPLTFTEGSTGVGADAVQTVANGDAFTGTLWLMATDMAGNSTVEKKGAYTYVLQALVYELEYTTDVTKEAYLNVTSVEERTDGNLGILVFDVHKKGDSDHYINLSVGTDVQYNGVSYIGNMLGSEASWCKANVTYDETNGYTVDILENAPGGVSGIAFSQYLSGYSGEVEVTVYAGYGQYTDSRAFVGSIQTDAFTYTKEGVPAYGWVHGADLTMDNSVSKETFTLRVVPENDTGRIGCQFTAVDDRLHHQLKEDISELRAQTYRAPIAYEVYNVNSSLAGMELSFRLTDSLGWNFADIDWENSGIWLYQNDAPFIKLCGISAASEQTVIFPVQDIPTGVYDYIALQVARITAPDDPYVFKVTVGEGANAVETVEVDATVPGVLQPGLLSVQPFVKQFNYREIDGDTVEVADGYPKIFVEKSEDFPRQLIDYDENSTILIPYGSVRVDMMFSAVDITTVDEDNKDSDPILRRGYLDELTHERTFGQYDVVAWNASHPEYPMVYLQSGDSALDTNNYGGYYAYDVNEYAFELEEDDSEQIVRIVPLNDCGYSKGQFCLTFAVGEKNVVYDGSDYFGSVSKARPYQLRLVPDEDNVIALQMRYVNGKQSEILYLTVHPVASSVPQGTVATEPEHTGDEEGRSYGTLVGESGKVAVRYTPAENENTLGMKYYLCRGDYENVNALIGENATIIRPTSVGICESQEMTLQGDGSYLAFVTDYPEFWYGDGMPHYTVVAQDAMGSLFMIPSPTYGIRTDVQGPVVTGDDEVDPSEGSFTATYRINDESLYDCLSKYSFTFENEGSNYQSLTGWPTKPLQFTLSVDDEYAAILGTASYSFTYDPTQVYSEKTVTYNDKWCSETNLTWEVPVQGNALGIDSITVSLSWEQESPNYQGMIRYKDSEADEFMMEVTVKGALHPKLGRTAAGDPDPTDVFLTLQVTDAFGHNTWEYVDENDEDTVITMKSAYTTKIKDAVGYTPHMVSAEYKVIGKTTPGFKGDMALFLKFSGPVQPVPSWICPDPQGYSSEWYDGFPIWKDGTWTIEYYDWEGTLHSEEITLTDVIGEYGYYDLILEPDLSTFTEGPILIQVADRSSNYNVSRGYFCSKVWPYTEHFEADMSVPMNDEDTATRFGGPGMGSYQYATENGVYVMMRGHTNGRGNYHLTTMRDLWVDYLFIYVNNIKERPQETLNFYFQDNMQSYNPDNLNTRDLETHDAVTVSYRTGRRTTPVGTGETEKTFRYGDDDSFEFTYYDPVMEMEFTISGKLSDYGITLLEPVQPATPVADTAAPNINRVGIWRQIGTRFEQAESFRVDADTAVILDVIREAFANTGVARSYDLILNVTDSSDWKLVLCETEPASGSLTFDSPSAEIPWVTVQGNNILIAPNPSQDHPDPLGEMPDTFWIAAVDHASAGAVPAPDNFTCFQVQKAWFDLDFIPPEVFTETVMTDFTERTVFIKAADDYQDVYNGTASSWDVTVSAVDLQDNDGSDPAHTPAEWPYMLVFNQNVTGVPVTATDYVGNTRQVAVSVEGIDSSVPTLSVTWSPCFLGTDGLNPAMAPSPDTPYNITVMAHVTSDKPIADAEGEYSIAFPEYPDSNESERLPCIPAEYSRRMVGGRMPLLYAFFDEKEVTVYFTEGYISDDFTGDGENEVAAAAYSVVLSVYGRNGQAAQISLNLGAGVVDKLAPEAKVEYKLLYHKKNVGGTLADYDEPYSCTATITFSEDVYLSSEDIDVEQGKLYIASTPLEVTLTDSESHYLSMTDKAGNQTKDLELNFITPSMPTPYPVLDSDPPELSIVAEERDSNNYIVFRVRVDDVNYIDSITADDETNVEIGNEDGDYDAEQNYYTYYPVTVKANGGYRITVTDAAGNSSAMTVMVSGVDLTLPTIIFETPTVAVRKGSTEAQLQDLLDAGVTLWDNVETDPDDPTRTWKDSLAYDTDGFTLEEVAYPAVDLNTVGTYSVQYTVTDLAGNVGMAIRHVRVLPDNLPEVKIDGRLTELNGTLGLGTGEHTLTVEHRTDDEPYTVKLARGLWSGGQIKYVVVDIPVGADGKFTLPSSGFYTLYILTQSRVSYRTLLYAGN